MRQKGLLLLAAVLLAACSYLLLARQTTATHVVLATHANAIDKPPVSDKIAAGATAEAATRPVLSGASVAPKITDPFARYDVATDLFPLAQELRERAERGDPDVVAALAELESECWMFVLSRGDRSDVPRFLQKRDPNIKPWVDSMLARSSLRCQRFTRNDLISYERLHEMLVAAAKQGSASAKARLLMGTVDIEHLPDATLAGTVRDILASGNPAAIVDLSNVMGVRVQGREKLFDLPSGSETESQAYLIAACRLGFECGPNSRILANLCFNANGCGYPSVDALVQDTMLTPQEYRVMQQEVQQILAKIPHR